jgi:hypothetical protein
MNKARKIIREELLKEGSVDFVRLGKQLEAVMFDGLEADITNVIMDHLDINVVDDSAFNKAIAVVEDLMPDARTITKALAKALEAMV